MRKITFLFGIVFCLGFIRLQAQSFEGTFIMQIMDDGSISRMRFAIKGDHVVIEPIDAALPRPVKIWMKKGDDKIYILTEEQGAKIAIMNTFVPPLEGEDKSEVKRSYSFTETGKKKMIGVYECRQVIVDNGEGQKLDMWVTSAMGFTLAQLFDNIGRFTATLNQGDYAEVTKNNAQELFQKNMALEINELKEGSSTQITIKDIVAQPLPAADFELKNYTIMDMSQMMGR